MKYLVILILTGFIVITSVDMAFGMCATQNLDWPDAPCHDAGESLEERRHDWSYYYDLKGDDWMTAMKIQLMTALRDDVLNEWLDERDDVAHWNVYTYYDQFENLDKYGGVYSPLKQLDYGFGLENIKCKENLVLIQKYDGSPACVTESTKTKLIERGWTIGKQKIADNEITSTPKYGTVEFDEEYQKAREIYLDVRKPMNLPFIGLTIDSVEKHVILGINSDKLTEEKDKKYHGQLIDELFNDVNLNIMIHYKNTTGLKFDE